MKSDYETKLADQLRALVLHRQADGKLVLVHPQCIRALTEAGLMKAADKRDAVAGAA